MPNYQRWGSHAQRLPPTPPEYSGSYLTPSSSISDDMHTFYPSQNYANRYMQPGRDFDRFQGNAFPHRTGSSGRSKPFHGNHDYNLGYSHQVASQQYYGPIAAPMLPPIRAPDDMMQYNAHYNHAHPEPKPKDEKPTGGVAQHLDYEMDTMASFVAEMSQRMYAMFASGLHLTDVNMMRSVSQGSSPTPQFRKYVSQILSSTRLPSSTIMLGLFYLQERMKILSQRNQDTSSSGTVYRMLTTCLLLGSKFLDDNTFQNRSWAEVSSIPVSELNVMELDWLKDFNWEIHGLMYDKEEGFFMWIKHWHTYQEKAQALKVKERASLVTPIDTSFARNHVPPRPLMSPDGPIPAQYQQDPQYDTQWVRPYISGYSPPSAPDSGPTTPEYYASQWSYPQAPQSYARASWGSNNGSAYHSHRALPSYQSQFPAFHGHSGWAGHGVGCGCTLCAKHSDYYFNHAGYGLQTVVG